ncbi:5'-nucleotidase C-terminal domain-containing protein [Pontivivens ytuae]|uniref:5'-nucleotidase C-terminal domain-containing protein n=1 Tax=Pontivivens ytuae TaxID=2789856 RepID=A0A7S9LSA5_9RHOB|nr:5'-nucleotidase C-terminal domain-containing protein [Pontivivens ytuae]QPH54040.1 5'-nucleotidase C-terminal domain-containing protein [Pontivivens ytuae]
MEAENDRTVKARLRLIATTDLHMSMTAEPLPGAANGTAGLAGLATAIEAARCEASTASLLFDVGDTLQGNAMADYIAQLCSDQPHPIYSAFNALGYDAVTFGNHDVDFGLDIFDGFRGALSAPMVNANMTRRDGGPGWRAFEIIEKEIAPGSTVRIGVTGVLPPRVMRWNRHHLHDRAEVAPCADAVEAVLPQIRAAGADLVVVLAHCGIVPPGHPDEDEQAALAIAALPGVDVVLCGHQHRTFPGQDIPPLGDRIDPIRGTLDEKPAIMAGWNGEKIGVLDLELEKANGAWRVAGHHTGFRVAGAPDRRVVDLAAPYLEATRDRLSEPLGRTSVPLDTTLAALADSAAVRVMRAAFEAAGKAALATDTPVIAAASPFRTGGRSGPQAFTRIRAGTLTRGDVADLCPYPNRMVAISATGRDVVDWLEMAAIHFETLSATGPTRRLLQPDVPGYNFDSLSGLSYEIDATQPPRFDVGGMLLDPTARRVRNLMRDGRPVRDEERFVVVVSSYRAGGGGNYRHLPNLPLVHDDLGLMSDIVANWVSAQPEGISLPLPVWRHAPSQPVEADLRTGAPLEIGGTIPPLRPLGETVEGWRDWRVTLGRR